MKKWEECLGKNKYTLPGNGKVLDDRDAEKACKIAEVEGRIVILEFLAQEEGLSVAQRVVCSEAIPKYNAYIKEIEDGAITNVDSDKT